MLSIRLLRTGKKNQPFYRMVVTDKKNPPRGGRFLEIVGFFNPFTKEKDIKADRIKHWLSVGAKPSDTVHNILVKEKVIDGTKIAVHKKPKKSAEGGSASGGKAVEAKAKAEAEKNQPAKPEVKEEAPIAEEPKVVEEAAKEEEPVKAPVESALEGELKKVD